MTAELETTEAHSLTFPATGQGVRVLVLNGEPWWVARDICEVLGYRKPSDATRRLDADEYMTIDRTSVQVTLGASGAPKGLNPKITLVNEAGLYTLILGSEKEAAKEFKRWVTHEVLPSIRKTGAYVSPTENMSRLEMAKYWYEAEARAELEAARAAHAENVVEQYKAGNGLSMREYHKKYFSDLTERRFNDHLYDNKWLIDQRNKTWDDRNGRHRDGRQHRHPTAKGKKYIYLHAGIGENGIRYENPRVRPEMELEFRDALCREGLPANNYAVTAVLFSHPGIEGGSS